MPVLAKFYGLVVKMFFLGSEHNPPHVHIIYQDYVGIIEIKTGNMLEGDLPHKALSMATEWVGLHRDELLDIWSTQNFRTLPPLE